MPAVFSQLINGLSWDFSSLVLKADLPTPITITRFNNFNYEQSLTPGVLRGNSAQKLGRTRGQYEASGSMSIYREEFDIVLALLGSMPPANQGWMEKSFDFSVSYGEMIGIPANDELQGIRIVRWAAQNAQGGDPTMIDVDFDIMKILLNGFPAVIDKGGVL